MLQDVYRMFFFVVCAGRIYLKFFELKKKKSLTTNVEAYAKIVFFVAIVYDQWSTVSVKVAVIYL